MLHQIFAAVKIVFRNLRKNWLYSSLNILGMCVAFATVILVFIYINQETSYESFYKNADRIYRPTYHIETQSNFETHWARIPVDYINHLPEEMPEVEKLIRFQNHEQKYLRIGEKKFKPRYAYVTDGDLFEVFDIPFLEGIPASALTHPNSIVLTESVALKYFLSTKVIGEEIMVSGDWSPDEIPFKVTGVMKDSPPNTHLPIEMLFSFASEEERTGWAYVYTMLAEGASISEVETKMSGFIKKYSDPESTTLVNYTFQPLKDIHLHSNLAREIKPNGRFMYIKICLWVGVFVWIIALINFTNLSTVLVMSRGKEIGVRKVLGASPLNLVAYAVVESILFCWVALFIGFLLVSACFPAFSSLTGISILPSPVQFFPIMIGISIVSAILAGILPGSVIVSVKTLQILSQSRQWAMGKHVKKVNIKSVLITAQFCVTIILIGSAMIAYLQFEYINKKNLGLKPDQIIAISEVPDQVVRQYPVFKNQIREIAGIRHVSACMQVPSSEIRDVGPVTIRGTQEDPEKAPMMDMQIIDPDFISMMGIELLAGEDFTLRENLEPVPEFNDDLTPNEYLIQKPRAYLINETAMKQLGWQDPEDAIGQEINWTIGSFELAYGPVRGVVKDFHQESLRNLVDPTIMVVEPLWLSNFLIQVETKELQKTLASIESTWNELFPYAFEYKFMDEMFSQLYSQDRVQLKLLGGLSIIAMFICFTGLISLVAFTLKRRSKELAIRRVIGADLKSLAGLIGKEYFWVLSIAALIGIPISYKWVSDWLENFAYHITITPVMYFLTVLLVFVLLIITIYLQTFKATIETPVNALQED